MKILFVLPWFLPNKGGMEIGAFEMARELVRRGHSVRIATLRYRRDWPAHETIDGIEVVRMTTLGYSGLARLSELSHSLSPFLTLGRVMDEFAPDIVHLHYILFTGHAGLHFARKRGVPTVLTLVGSDVYDPHHMPAEFLFPWNRKVVRSVDRVVAACRFIGKEIERKFGRPGDRIDVIPYGVNPGRFAEGAAPQVRAKFGIPADAPMVLTVQRLHERKGVHYGLRAAEIILRENLKAYFVVVGDGPERPKLERVAAEAGLSGRIIFTGKASFGDLAALYNEADLFAFHTLHEGFGIVLLEAMSCGKATVTTKAGGTEDIVDDGVTGVLVPPAQPEPFAQAVLDLLNNPSLREEMGRRGKARVDAGFSWPRVVDRYVGIYEELLSRKRHAAQKESVIQA